MLRRIILLALGAAIVSAQAQSVIDLARKAPPEMFADTVIRLERRDLLDEAFNAAKNAKEPIRLRALPIAPSNSRAALRDAAGELGLDALSLETRVIRLMAMTDPQKARELFQSIEHPKLETGRCEDPMIADVSAYYDTAGLLAAGQSRLLMMAMGPANSPGELAAFAKALEANRSLPAEDFGLLAGALALKMQAAAPDYRAFTTTADELRTALEGIAARAKELGVAPGASLAEGARKLIVTQMTSPRCNEEFGDAMKFVEWFNGARRGARANQGFRGDLPMLMEEELQPPNSLGFFKTQVYFDSEDGKKISEDFVRLRSAPGQLAEFLKEFAAWKPEGSAIDVFHQKITVLHGLYQLIPVLPPGEDLDALIPRAVELLRSNGIEREYPAEWLLQVRSLAGSPMGNRTKLMAAFRESGDAGLELFAALDAASKN